MARKWEVTSSDWKPNESRILHMCLGITGLRVLMFLVFQWTKSRYILRGHMGL